MRASHNNIKTRKPLGDLPVKTPEDRPVLIIVSGLPGTGKSYFSRKLAERLHFLVLESDDIRKKLFPEPDYSMEENIRLFDFIHRRIYELLGEGASVILDATNLTEKHRRVLYHIAEDNEAWIIIVQVDAPPEVVKKRLESRLKNPGINDKSDADWTVYQRLKPTVEQIGRRHFYVNSAWDITPMIDKIVKAVNR